MNPTEEMTGMAGLTATASTDVAATREQVWRALTEPTCVKRWMGSDLETDWRVGSPITWSGEFQGRPYQDTGEVLAYDEPELLSVSHVSPLMGDEDEPESQHTLTWTLTDTDDGGTHLEMSQDGCDDEEQAAQFAQNWQSCLDALKDVAEA